MDDLYAAIGFELERKNVDTLTLSDLKKMYKTLGYPVNANRAVMSGIVHRKIPHDLFVFQKIVRSWCMAPNKSQSKAVKTAFRCGRLAEPLIEGSIQQFVSHHSNATLAIVVIMNVGLLRSHGTPIAALSRLMGLQF